MGKDSPPIYSHLSRFFFFIKFNFVTYMGVLATCILCTYGPGAQGGQNWISDSLELEL